MAARVARTAGASATSLNTLEAITDKQAGFYFSIVETA